MARPSKTAAIDYTTSHALTHGLLDRAACPPDKAFALLKDADKKGLRLRITKAGGKHWQFETRIKGALFTRALGEWPAVSIGEAQSEAHRLRGLAEKGIDPRELERQQAEAREVEQKRRAAELATEQQRQLEAERKAIAHAVTVGEVWNVYLAERRPHWGEAHYLSHLEKANPGGKPSKRRGMADKLTKPGPLAPLMPLALKALDAPTIERWAAIEGQARPSSARLALRLLSVFWNWCTEQPQYADMLPAKNPTKAKKAREALGKPIKKEDVLTGEQLPAWFAAVGQLQNRAIAAYLQTLLLTGARPGEVLEMRWEDINTKWRGLTIRDKVEGERVIPLTPYVHHLIAALPRRNGWVFASARTLQLDSKNLHRRAHKAAKRGTHAPVGDILETSASGHVSRPNAKHAQACAVAGIDDLTLHGLRRSFASLTEWLEIPAGVVAQIQGHKPSATAEKHYKRRPLDLLRLHHERVEAWILEQAGVTFDRKTEPVKLALVVA